MQKRKIRNIIASNRFLEAVMKIILSRKGFDSVAGGYPSPIMPDGTLLSIPVPSRGDEITYSDLYYNGESYSDILSQLYPECQNWRDRKCHCDPDIRYNRKIEHSLWTPAFGQAASAQGVLKNAGVGKGDIFLFFGWFRRAEKAEGVYKLVSSADDFYTQFDLHIVFGYLQVEDVLTKREEIAKYSHHPHSKYDVSTNALYIPTDRLSLNPDLPGYGTLTYRKDRVLTKEGRNRSIWNEYEFLMPNHVYGNRKNSATKSGLFYRGQWQELVVEESKELEDWARSIILP